jgi:predicted O-methyltransferase YrrM
MELVHLLAEQYAEQHTSPHDNVLAQIHAATLQEHQHAHMLSSTVQGQFLQCISQIQQPKYILEIGTFTGYSAICLCKGLQENGQLHTIELREADAITAQKNFSIAKVENKVTLHLGNAKEIIPHLNFSWDLIFIDADKVSYVDYYELVLPQLNPNGLIIADNVLFHGQVLEESVKGKNALAIDQFNKHVAEDDRTEQVLLTVRDGLLLIRKK